MEPEYRLEDGQYAFYLKGERKFVTEEVAILFDQDLSVLLKHGPPAFVDSEFRRMHLAFGRTRTLFDVADGLTVIRGKFDIEELNKVVQICDYVGRFYKKLEAQAGADASRVISAVAA